MRITQLHETPVTHRVHRYGQYSTLGLTAALRNVAAFEHFLENAKDLLSQSNCRN